MAELKFEREITALLVIDPYNDFISEGGKFWPHLKTMAEANNCVPNMLHVLNAARAARLRVFYPLHRRYRPGDYETWSTLRPSRRGPGRARRSNTARGVVRSARSSNLSRMKSWSSSIGVPVASPTRIWICNSRSMASISSSLQDSSHTPVWKRLFVMRLSWATKSRW